MPRACLLHARCFTNADLPILPFLAPRVFAESPFRRARPQHNGTAFAKKQGKDNVERTSGKDTLQIWPGLLCKPTQATNATPSHGFCGAKALQRPTTRRCHTPAPHAPLRFWRTYTSKAHNERSCSGTPSRSLRSGRNRLRPSSINSTSAKSMILKGKAVHFRKVSMEGRTRDNVSSSLPQHTEDGLGLPARPEGALVKRRRLKNLEQEITRYQDFLSRFPHTPASRLVRKGRYRSLSRRIMNLQRESVEEAQMTQEATRSDERFGDSVIMKGFAALDRRVYSKSKRRTHVLTIRHDPSCERWATEICKDASIDNTEKMWTNWMAFNHDERNEIWHLLLLFFLDKQPDRALQFLRVLTHEPYVKTWRPEIIADAFEHLARLAVQDERRTRLLPNVSYLVPTFSYVFRENLAKVPGICSQDLLWNVARLASASELGNIFDLLIKSKTYMDYDTFLHYANVFGERGEHQNALRCLQEILSRTKHKLAPSAVVARRRFFWSCALILRKSLSGGQNYHLTNQIVADIIALGVKLDILLYNVIIHNAMDAADPTTAFRVYNILEENGLKPDKHTYSILLHGCTMTPNPASYHEIAETCANLAKKLKDPWLATDYLHYIYMRHQHDTLNHLQTVLTRTYAQFFSIEALEPFGLYSESRAQHSIPNEAVNTSTFEPTPMAIYIMIQVEIQKVSAMGNTQIFDLYCFFKRLVAEGNYPILNALARQPYIWNTFLLAFCKGQQFQSASQLIKDMTESRTVNIPRPNVYSWNIFMQAFFKTDQVRAAERIFEIMRSRGIEPDQFTYGVLLMGYAKAQQLTRIGDVMQYVDDESGIDGALLQSLMQVHDRKKLMVKLENARKMKEEKSRMDLATAELERETLAKTNFFIDLDQTTTTTLDSRDQ